MEWMAPLKAPYPVMALRTNIAKNIPDKDNPINLVAARSFMARELGPSHERSMARGLFVSIQ